MWTCPKCGEQIEDQFDSCWKCAANMTAELGQTMTKCFKCGGTEIAKGEISASGNKGLLSQTTFQPDGLRFLTFTLSNGTTLQRESYACLNCGTVWSQTDENGLREFIRKHC